MIRPRVGIALQPEARFLDLMANVIAERCEILEITPETCWRFGADGVRPNGFYRRNLDIVRDLGLPTIGHGVNLSVGTGGAADEPRFSRWLGWIARTHEDFQFQWYSDHFGQTMCGDEFVALPMPVPFTVGRVQAIRGRLDRLSRVIPIVGLETTAMPFWLSDAGAEPAAITVATEGHHIVLDVHNLWVMSRSGGLDPADYVRQLPLDRVIEIHLSGGSDSDPEWLPSRRSWPLDSHDTAVPEPVWDLFARTWSRCPNLRAVILERRDGTVTPDDVPILRDELIRIGEHLSALTPASDCVVGTHSLESTSGDDTGLAEALRTQAPPPPGVHGDLWRLASIQVARLRWERLLNGSGALDAWYERDPEAFVALFRRYHASTPATAYYPAAEAALFRTWCDATGVALPL